MAEPVYPNVKVKLSHIENPYILLQKVSEAMHKAGVPEEKIRTVCADASIGTYEQLWETIRKNVTVS
ncbi:MAG: hypothetical protein HN578_01630 [Rhodospirillales bacterium]|jgi:hypothetical protein|nr:hypothetical protein [Rhodospirillales bacterium]